MAIKQSRSLEIHRMCVHYTILVTPHSDSPETAQHIADFSVLPHSLPSNLWFHNSCFTFCIWF